jgi:predicted ArsR family transcriptional regulator
VYEFSEYGRELFPRKYFLFLNYVLKKIAEKDGEEHVRKIIESVADVLAMDVKERIEKSGSSRSLKDSLKILNLVSNELGFASVLAEGTEGADNPDVGHERSDGDLDAYSIISKNCILHRVALENQDAVCHGLHDMMIRRSLDGKSSNVNVELRECMALGNAYCRHVITTADKKSKKNSY